mmetsp:Transcript_20235/g.42046  ORF Transcript_20235/g.42046 Transcript_20235/m.42046 type:complete len:326 (+) Transcript_20235:519-1496(+)
MTSRFEERFPSSVGSRPDMKLLSSISRVRSCSSKPNSVGMVPTRFGLSLMLKVSRLDQVPIWVGRVPEKPRVFQRRRIRREGSSIGGSSPARSVLERSRKSRLVRRPPPPASVWKRTVSKRPPSRGLVCSSRCFNRCRLPREEGMVPYNKFPSRARFSRFVHSPIQPGMVVCNWFLERTTVSSWLKAAHSSGIFPCNRWSEKSMRRRLVSSPISVDREVPVSTTPSAGERRRPTTTRFVLSLPPPPSPQSTPFQSHSWTPAPKAIHPEEASRLRVFQTVGPPWSKYQTTRAYRCSRRSRNNPSVSSLVARDSPPTLSETMSGSSS